MRRKLLQINTPHITTAISLFLFFITLHGTTTSTAFSPPFSLKHSMSLKSTLRQGGLQTKEEENPNLATDQNDEEPLMTFGVLADIQYAPIPDGFSFSGTPRYYRHALQAASHAANHFEEENVDLLVNLGDIIDGKCQEIEKWCKEEIEDKKKENENTVVLEGDDKLAVKGTSTRDNSCASMKQSNPGHDAVDDVVKALSVFKKTTLHTYGNHELYNLSREEISQKLGIPFTQEPCGELVGYYTYISDRCPKLRFVVLDSYDISILQRCSHSSRKRQKAVQILTKNNPNYLKGEENSPVGLDGIEKRYVAFNGAVDEPQKIWLQQTLEKAKKCGEKVIILSHQPIIPKSSGDVCLIWNWYDILDILRDYKCTVAAAFSGHAHKGGYLRDEESHIHFRVFEACLESNYPTKTYAIVDYHHDRLVVRGFGDCKSATYKLDHLS